MVFFLSQCGTLTGGIGFKGYETESQGQRCIQEICMELRGFCVGVTFQSYFLAEAIHLYNSIFST